MEHLRTLFAELGLASVETFIASGNVIFGAPKEDARVLEARIATHLRQALGYDVATFVRSPSQLAGVADCRPFPTGELDAPGVTLTIAFLSDPPEAEAERALMAFRSTVNDFHDVRSTGCAARRPPNPDSPERFSRRRSACPPHCATRTQ
jgi:uncharacterized protein (DUF1697 family)